ncbi:hypothetical protein [Siccibacter colletis]|uniref:hypothetical protein n=1 Tax=Siccibacter colletis TaxID=1505757 RepID=UPI00068A6602|nr:hypothetical protein [Siccibacter colletis]
MIDSLNNKELVAASHEFAMALSSDTAICDIAKMISRLAERLDCITTAMRQSAQKNDGLPDNASTLILHKELNDRDGLKCRYSREKNGVCDNKLCCIGWIGQGVITRSIEGKIKCSDILVRLPKLSKSDLELFQGRMLKALMVGEIITKKAVIETMQEYGITIQFIR